MPSASCSGKATVCADVSATSERATASSLIAWLLWSPTAMAPVPPFDDSFHGFDGGAAGLQDLVENLPDL
jgi:hypothetical protein